MKNYPLLCGFREMVAGDGFLASVAIDGRALGVQEDDGTWWIYGVNPGAIAETGATLAEAHAALLRAFKAYTLDVASESKDFAAFDREVRRFFEQGDQETRAEWEAAVVEVRAGRLDLDPLPKVDSRQSVFAVRVHQIATPTPAENQLAEGLKFAA